MKKCFKIILKIGIFFCLFILVGKVLFFLLYDDSQIYTRTMMKELYSTEENIDALFMGSSHSYMSIYPSAADEKLKMYSFNTGSSAQCPDGTYALLKEVDKDNEIKVAFLEVYYGVIGDHKFKDRSNLVSTYLITDYMKPSWNRLTYLWNAGSKKHFVNSFIPARRYWNKLLQPGYIKQVIETKMGDDYRNMHTEEKEKQCEYIERGYVACYKTMDDSPFMNKRAYGDVYLNNLSDSDWKRYLDKIAEYCRDNEIELVLYTAPEPQVTLIGKNNYNLFNEYVVQYAKEQHLCYWDFNLAKKEYFDTTNMSMFSDADHLSVEGAKEFTELLCGMYIGEVDRNIFYDSIKDKVADEKSDVKGVACSAETQGTEYWNCYVISCDVDNEEYHVVVHRNDGSDLTLLEYGDENSFDISPEERGSMEVFWRKKDNPSCEGAFCVALE